MLLFILSQPVAMGRRSWKPTHSPIKVPITLPNVPTNTAGSKRLCQFNEDASAEAVAALPIFALDPNKTSGNGTFKTQNPPTNIEMKWIR